MLYEAIFCGAMLADGTWQANKRCTIEEAERDQNYMVCTTMVECRDKHGVIFSPMYEEQDHEHIPR